MENQPKKRILIVDDDPGIIAFLENKLLHLGYEVFKGANGFEALALVKQAIPDLIILDQMMPKMNGVKTCALLKSDKRFAKIPVIMFTVSAEKSAQKLSLAAGVDFYLTKPFNTEVLFAKVQEMLGKSAPTET